MKNILKYFAGIAAAAALFACSPYEDYTTTAFVVLDANTIEIPEGPYTAGTDTLISIPVHIQNHKDACTVAYTVTDVDATAGTDYTLVDNSGVLNFAAGVETQEIEIKISGQPGLFTGNLSFIIALTSATNDVVVAATNECEVVIKDLDHPLSALFGTWNIDAVNLGTSGSYGYYTHPIVISAYAGDATKVWIDHITLFTYNYASYLTTSPAVYANVSSDLKTISIPVPQTTKAHSSDMFNGVKEDDFFTLYAFTGTNPDALEWDKKPGNITFTLQADGSYTTADSYGLNIPSFVAKPDWLYYYMFAFTSFNAAYPTVIYK